MNMYSIVTVVREVKGNKREEKMLFGTGRLTSDPPAIQEVKGGYKVLRGRGFSIAFSNGKDKPATFFPLVFWGKNAENMEKLGFKGQLIEVAGRIETQSYTAQDGTQKTREVLVVEKFECKQYKKQSEEVQEENPWGEEGATEIDISDDDLPF